MFPPQSTQKKSVYVKYFAFVFLFFVGFFNNTVFAETPLLERQDFQKFIKEVVDKHHFKKAQLISLFKKVKIHPQVMVHIKKPLEQKPWHTYQMLFVNDWRITHGVLFWNKYKTALQRAEETYGVPAAIIVATIGVETRYGERTGEYRVLDSLTNIAFSESTRASFFRQELIEFLLLTREQKLDPLKIMGSYAGAIGQPQFMPSSYRYYAVNFSKSGKIDLMHNEIDVIGSIANYYQKHGWENKGLIAEPALIIGDRYEYLARKNKINPALTIAELTRLGVVPRNKTLQDELKVKVIELESGYSREYWLGFHNFDVIKRYNTSDLYAMAVYQLSVYITALRERLNK